MTPSTTFREKCAVSVRSEWNSPSAQFFSKADQGTSRDNPNPPGGFRKPPGNSFPFGFVAFRFLIGTFQLLNEIEYTFGNIGMFAFIAVSGDKPSVYHCDRPIMALNCQRILIVTHFLRACLGHHEQTKRDTGDGVQSSVGHFLLPMSYPRRTCRRSFPVSCPGKRAARRPPVSRFTPARDYSYSSGDCS